jgi:hypothetical protein
MSVGGFGVDFTFVPAGPGGSPHAPKFGGRAFYRAMNAEVYMRMKDRRDEERLAYRMIEDRIQQRWEEFLSAKQDAIDGACDAVLLAEL